MQGEGQNSFRIIMFCHERFDLLNQDIKMLQSNNVKSNNLLLVSNHCF